MDDKAAAAGFNCGYRRLRASPSVQPIVGKEVAADPRFPQLDNVYVYRLWKSTGGMQVHPEKNDSRQKGEEIGIPRSPALQPATAC